MVQKLLLGLREEMEFLKNALTLSPQGSRGLRVVEAGVGSIALINTVRLRDYVNEPSASTAESHTRINTGKVTARLTVDRRDLIVIDPTSTRPLKVALEPLSS